MQAPDKCISIVGMPTSGKTTLGLQLADVVGLSFLDSDQLFEAEQGMSINEYVAQHDWQSFRSQEEHIIAEAIKPKLVLSLGGGAIESEKTRLLLAEKTIVVWIRAELNTILERLGSQKKGEERPQLTELSLEQETIEKLDRRNPQFASIADIELSAEAAIDEQIEQIRSRLGV